MHITNKANIFLVILFIFILHINIVHSHRDHHHNYRHKHKKLKDHHHGDIGKHDHEGLHPKHYYFHHFHYEPHKVDSQIVCGDICAISLLLLVTFYIGVSIFILRHYLLEGRIRNGWTRLPDVESVVHDKDEKFKDAKEIKDVEKH
ncbi:hypothetical protein C2G38_2063782 [Gigaspora rosea]|uniref:Uncharacterized protein n=1 Tax=Gigaspora rosea TaxID=44941 RepID=A0A397VW97_9GLOM|nr:hypothetical protein C2G38_2063782 [Gigaspora rosea]